MAFPIHQGARAPDGKDFLHDVLRVGDERTAEHVRIVLERRERTRQGGLFRGQLEKRRTPEDQPDETIRRAGGGIEERSALFVGVVFVIGLGIEARQETFTGGLDRIFPRDDRPCTRPRREIGVVIRMRRIYRHDTLIPRVSPAPLRPGFTLRTVPKLKPVKPHGITITGAGNGLTGLGEDFFDSVAQCYPCGLGGTVIANSNSSESSGAPPWSRAPNPPSRRCPRRARLD